MLAYTTQFLLPLHIRLIGRYPSKVEVANINNARLAALDTPLQQFVSSDVPGVNSKGYQLDPAQATEVLNRNTIWPQELHVKKGAMVMLVTVSINMSHYILHRGRS